MKTPIRYAGGKSRAIKHISPYLDNETKIVSPFMGGGSLEVNWASKGIEVIGYDLFDAIMKAREVQAENMAKLLVHLAIESELPIVILGKSYKPNVTYEDGSSSILVGHYCSVHGVDPSYDLKEPIKAVYLLGHMDKHHDYNFTDGSIVVDPWRTFVSENTSIDVIQYGNTR